MKAVIIEDETLVAKELQNKIQLISDDVQVIEHLTSLKTARKWFMQNAEPDLLFMDIQLSDGVSFDLFEQFNLNCPVIFTTAYDEYAIRAFKVNGIDYLLKPIDDEDLRNAIEKSKRYLQAQWKPGNQVMELVQNFQNRQIPLFKEKFIVNHHRQWIPVNTSDIACFVRDNLNYLYTFNGEKYILDYATLEEIEELLNPNVFYRANRQFIIHIDAIQAIKPQENQKLSVSLTAPLKFDIDVSREKAPSFKRWLDR
jgi:DNA-binding LytR/AlgR family response regulator